jgi:hypothetical protein
MSTSRGLAPPRMAWPPRLPAQARRRFCRHCLVGPHTAYPAVPYSHLPPTSPNTPSLPTSPSFTPEPMLLPPFHSPMFLPFSPAKVRPWCSWPIRRSGATRAPPPPTTTVRPVPGALAWLSLPAWRGSACPPGAARRAISLACSQPDTDAQRPRRGVARVPAPWHARVAPHAATRALARHVPVRRVRRTTRTP